MNENKNIVLSLRDLTFGHHRSTLVWLENANLTIHEGDLLMLQIDRSQHADLFSTVLLGLQSPDSGNVTFLSQAWTDSDYDRHFYMRSRIGRIFDENGWIQSLNVLENVTLSSRHHGLTISEANERARKLAMRFGLKQVAAERPAFVETAILQIHQWIRVFMTPPSLLILERPLKAISTKLQSTLTEMLDDARAAGTAVLWMTSDRDDLAIPFRTSIRKRVIQNGRFATLTETDQ